MRHAHPEPYGLPQGLTYVPQEFADETRRAAFRRRVRIGAVLGLLIGAMLGLLLLAVLAAVAQNDTPPAPGHNMVTPSTYPPPAH